jgi:hypothetical protein
MNVALTSLTTPVGVIATLLLLGSPVPSPVLRGSPGPQVRSPEKGPLARVKRLKCTFSVFASGDWKNGDPEGHIKAEDVVLQVEAIDAEEGSAQIVGTDPTPITALLTASSLHLMERSMAGNLTVTTVFAQANSRGRLRAVRSQHDYIQMAIPGFVSEPTVTQRYGECEPGQ